MAKRPTKAGKMIARAHKAADRIQIGYPAPYSKLAGKSLIMVGWIDGYRARVADEKEAAIKAQGITGVMFPRKKT